MVIGADIAGSQIKGGPTGFRYRLEQYTSKNGSRLITEKKLPCYVLVYATKGEVRPDTAETATLVEAMRSSLAEHDGFPKEVIRSAVIGAALVRELTEEEARQTVRCHVVANCSQYLLYDDVWELVPHYPIKLPPGVRITRTLPLTPTDLAVILRRLEQPPGSMNQVCAICQDEEKTTSHTCSAAGCGQPVHLPFFSRKVEGQEREERCSVAGEREGEPICLNCAG